MTTLTTTFHPGCKYRLANGRGGYTEAVCRYVYKGKISFWIAVGGDFYATEDEDVANLLLGQDGETVTKLPY